MAFATSESFNRFAPGIGKLAYGTFTNSGGGTGGDIEVGMTTVQVMLLQHTGNAVVANAPAVNESFPFTGSAPTIVTDADKSGLYLAIGDI